MKPLPFIIAEKLEVKSVPELSILDHLGLGEMVLLNIKRRIITDMYKLILVV